MKSLFLSGITLALVASTFAHAEDHAWPTWRGPNQDGTSAETNLPDEWKPGGANDLWSIELAGRGTPAVANGRVYAIGYEGEGPDLQEMLVCLDERTGEKLWEHREHDFLSDVIYSRYAIGAPTIDPDTGNIYWLTTPGLLHCFSPDGEVLWSHSMMEAYGRLTFPNGRTGAPIIEGDMLIARGITSNWASNGPARDRFYAFDKRTGRSIWSCTPGTAPKDSCFSHPVLEWRGDRRVLYAGTGCGHVVCIDARTGQPIWRFQMSIGGVNSSVLLADDRLLAIHGRENLDSSEIGRGVAIRLGDHHTGGAGGPTVLSKDDEIWRNLLEAFSSSPVLVGDRLYMTVMRGDLCCVDTETGKIIWEHSLGEEQIHASPVYADGKLYIPMNHGEFYIVRPSDEGAEVLSAAHVEGSCLGAPAISAGRIFVHTTERLYCFGDNSRTSPAPARQPRRTAQPQEPVALVCTPAELELRPGETVSLEAWSVDRNGATVAKHSGNMECSVPARLGLNVSSDGAVVVDDDAKPGAAEMTVKAGGVEGKVRVRIVSHLPYVEDFENVTLDKPLPSDPSQKWALPPSHWLSAGPKWRVQNVDGDNVLVRRMDNALFQRTMSFIGGIDSGYTMTADVMTDGNRRMKSSPGLVNQRYIVVLKGNHQELEITSNHERLKYAVPFKWRPKVWYRLTCRVDLEDDGTAVVRAKCWPRDEAEPDDWTIEFRHADGHAEGAPGLYGFTPQSRFAVYMDNISVVPHE